MGNQSVAPAGHLNHWKVVCPRQARERSLTRDEEPVEASAGTRAPLEAAVVVPVPRHLSCVGLELCFTCSEVRQQLDRMVDELEQVVCRCEAAVSRQRPGVGVAADAVRPAVDLDEKKAAGSKRQGVDLVD